MIGCYILFSEKLNRFYIGITQEGLNERLAKHNEHSYGKKKYTAKANDWVDYLFIETIDIKHAASIEKHIKKMKSATYIKNLKKYPEIIQKLKTV